MDNEQVTYYFTFNVGQEYAGCYVVVKADSSNDAIQMMYDNFDHNWARQYEPAESMEEAGVQEYNLKKIDLIET